MILKYVNVGWCQKHLAVTITKRLMIFPLTFPNLSKRIFDMPLFCLTKKAYDMSLHKITETEPTTWTYLDLSLCLQLSCTALVVGCVLLLRRVCSLFDSKFCPWIPMNDNALLYQFYRFGHLHLLLLFSESWTVRLINAVSMQYVCRISIVCLWKVQMIVAFVLPWSDLGTVLFWCAIFVQTYLS